MLADTKSEDAEFYIIKQLTNWVENDSVFWIGGSKLIQCIIKYIVIKRSSKQKLRQSNEFRYNYKLKLAIRRQCKAKLNFDSIKPW